MHYVRRKQREETREFETKPTLFLRLNLPLPRSQEIRHSTPLNSRFQVKPNKESDEMRESFLISSHDKKEKEKLSLSDPFFHMKLTIK